MKTAYELACERIIAPRYSKKEEKSEKLMDFIPIPELDDKEDKIVDDSNETKILDDIKEDIKKKEIEEKNMSNIKIQESESISYEDFLEVHWNGHFMGYNGFDRLNRNMVFGLSNRNVKVKVDIEPYLVHINKSTQAQLRSMANTQISPSAPKVYGTTIPLAMSHPGKKILYTMIETSEKVHKDYAEKLNLMGEVWVATEYGKKILSNSNVRTPIHVMPLGVDVDRYRPSCGAINFGSATRDFKFISVFRWSYRKGFDILLRAFMEEFSENENVSLIMVSRAVQSPEEIGVDKIVQDFNDIKSCVKKSPEELPHIALYTKPIDEKDMPKVYSSANAFVLISRGEGFGLPYIEAASCGLPVIGSNCSGQTDFLKEDNSYLVDPDGFTEAKINGNMSSMAKLCYFYEGQIFPNFGDAAIQKTKEHMRNVFENYNEAKIKAEKLRKLIVNNYTWGMAIDRVYNRLREIS